MNERIAHIVYATDDNFAEILGVSLISLYENSKDMEEIIVYILDSGISDLNIEKIKIIADKYERREPIFIKAKNICTELGMKVTLDRGSVSQYARLFVSSNLPKDLDRILYLDCDVMVEKSIFELWNLDLQGKTVAALMDAFSTQYRINIDLQPNDIMFNSGVMLIDLLKWKKQRIEDKLLQFIENKKGKIQQGDQGCLNSVLSHEIYCFEPRFNVVTIFFDFTYKEMLTYRKPPFFYSEEAIRKAVEDPTIIHFTTSFLSKRAWIKGCEHKYVDKWLKYRELSPWNGIELSDDNRPWWKQKGLLLFRKLPRNIAIRMARYLHVYCRPLIYRLQNTFD